MERVKIQVGGRVSFVEMDLKSMRRFLRHFDTEEEGLALLPEEWAIFFSEEKREEERRPIRQEIFDPIHNQIGVGLPGVGTWGLENRHGFSDD